MIIGYTLDQSEEWDHLVRSFKNYDVYYLSGYVKSFMINGDGVPLLIYFSGNDTKAINVVMKRDIAECEFFNGKVEYNTYFDFTTPYGYGGFLVEGSDIKSLQIEYEKFCLDNNVVSEFVRFHPLLENWKQLENLYQEKLVGNTVYLDTSNKDIIWANMTSKNRNVVRKAQKNGLRVYWGRDPEIIDPFMDIYNKTMDKNSAEKYYYFDKNFYESILEDMKQNAMWFYTKMEKNIAAISIFLFCNGKMHYHLSASKKEYQSLGATNLLIYEAALWAANHGYEKLHLGGGVGSSHDSLYEFKKSFNRGEDSEFFVGKKIFMQEKYTNFVQMRIDMNSNFDPDTNFFPVYRERI